MTHRDRYILTALGVVGILAAFWLLALGPKRKELTRLDKDVQQSQQAANDAKQQAQDFARARLEFPRDYRTVVDLGKAVPSNPDVPSLLVQLDHAASEAGVSFRTIELKSGGETGEQAASPPASSSASSSSATGATGAQGSSSAGATGQSGPQAPSSAGATGQSSAQPSSSSGGSAGGATGAPGPTTGQAAPANATATPALPIGTAIGPAQLPILRLDLIFQGSFFRMADFIHNVRQMVKRQDRRLVVSGRLLTIEGMAFSEGDFGFPQIKATIAATSYLVPESQGLLVGATVQGPAGAKDSASSTVSSTSGPSAPPAAVVTP